MPNKFTATLSSAFAHAKAFYYSPKMQAASTPTKVTAGILAAASPFAYLYGPAVHNAIVNHPYQSVGAGAAAILTGGATAAMTKNPKAALAGAAAGAVAVPLLTPLFTWGAEQVRDASLSFAHEHPLGVLFATMTTGLTMHGSLKRDHGFWKTAGLSLGALTTSALAWKYAIDPALEAIGESIVHQFNKVHTPEEKAGIAALALLAWSSGFIGDAVRGGSFRKNGISGRHPIATAMLHTATLAGSIAGSVAIDGYPMTPLFEDAHHNNHAALRQPELQQRQLPAPPAHKDNLRVVYPEALQV